MPKYRAILDSINGGRRKFDFTAENNKEAVAQAVKLAKEYDMPEVIIMRLNPQTRRYNKFGDAYRSYKGKYVYREGRW